jgi:hypothetical protein
MPAPDWEDLTEFFDVTEFADTAEITTAAGQVLTVAGIYDDPYLNAQLGEYQMDISDPRFTCKETDVQGVKRGDVAVIDGKEYDILTAPQSDGTGVAVLKLASPPPDA